MDKNLFLFVYTREQGYPQSHIIYSNKNTDSEKKKGHNVKMSKSPVKEINQLLPQFFTNYSHIR